jgi:hypothetical protein
MVKTDKRVWTFAATVMAVLTGLSLAIPGMATATTTEPLNDQFSVRWDTEGGGLRRRIVESPTAPGGAALEVSMRRRLDEPWRSRVTVPLVSDIREGDVIELRVWIRAESPIGSQETGNLDLQIVRTSEPYDNIFSENIRPTDEGQFYVVSGVAGADFDADDVVFGANLGYGRQTIQFGPIFINRVSSAD